jgi:hypothetical protein
MWAPPLRGCTGVLFCYYDVETRVRQGGGVNQMRTRRLLPIALAGIIGTSGGVSVAPAQPTAKPAIVKPAIVRPTETRTSDPPPMTFFVATGEADACGSGCEAWIAADGKVDLDAAQRLRKLLAKLARRRLPIFLHSGGGSVLGAIELGRLIRSRNVEVSVARTVPAECSRDRLSDKSCEMLKRSGKDLVSELDSNGAMCNSACVLTLSGGAVRSVPPLVRLGVHAIGIDLGKTQIRGAAIADATRAANSRIVEFLRDMGINKALFDTSNSVPHESTRFLQRDELVRFGIDTREFGETDWRFVEKPNAAIAKGFFVRSGEAAPAHPEALLRLTCGARKAMRLTLARERGASNRIGASARPLRVTVNGSRIDLPYATPGETIEMRTTVLWPSVIDSADDKGAIEISGFGPERDNEPQGRIILNMAGFSAAYAKLRKACDASSSPDNGCGVGDLSPRCMPDALRTWPVMPPTAGGQTAWPSR